MLKKLSNKEMHLNTREIEERTANLPCTGPCREICLTNQTLFNSTYASLLYDFDY